MSQNDLLILSHFKGSTHTANELIEKVRRADHESGVYRMSVHFYTHLNKRFDPLKKSGMLTHVGYKRGPSNRDEKLWKLTLKAEALLMDFSSDKSNSIAA